MTGARVVAVDPEARRAYPFMRGVVYAVPGLILEDEGSGTRLRVLEDGRLERLLPGGHPRPGAAHSVAR